MKDFIANIKEIVNSLDVTTDSSVAGARQIIYELNRFLYTNREGIGTTWALEAEREYFSDFHKYWEAHYKDVLDPMVDDTQCEIVADALHDVFGMSPEAFTELYDTCGLEKKTSAASASSAHLKTSGGRASSRSSRRYSNPTQASSHPSEFTTIPKASFRTSR